MVADLGFGLPPQTALRTCVLASALARRMGCSDAEVRDAFYVGLLMHIGCVGVAHEAAVAFGDDIALNRAVARTNFADPNDIGATLIPEMTRDMSPAQRDRAIEFAVTHGNEWGRRTDIGVCEVARDTARRIGLPDSTQRGLYEVFESWIGGWAPRGLKGEEIALPARIARAAGDAALFDGLSGPDAAVDMLQRKGGVILDPGVVEVFCAASGDLFAEVNDRDPRDRILEVEPGPVVERTGTDIVAVAAAFGDLADVKAPHLHGHARKVARLARGAARRLGVADAEGDRLEIAALLHDVGRVGVSNAIWEKPGPLTRGEWEQVRMHGYHSERILATSASLESVASTAGMHHERLDGSGYHRCSTGTGLPVAARILAVADAYSAMTQPRPHRPALVPERAADELRAEATAGRLDPDATAAVLEEAGLRGARPAGPKPPAGLSEREVEVLALVAEGHSNTQVAERLFISRRTAEHHIQHVYAKTGVSTRAAAALFAVHHGLVGPQ
jgi:HD-GYP domain-containing protein (c-di-GMP phosphodiesterase class II)/DNA-binding CsgD family transcriptional regulator